MPALLLRYWKPLAIVALLLTLFVGARAYVQNIDRSARVQQKIADAAAVTAAQQQAHIADLEKARATEALNTAKKEAADDSLAPALDAARKRLAVYAAQLRDQAPKGGGGGTDLPSTADAAAVVVRSDRDAVLADDLDRCTEAVVRLENVRAWWYGLGQ